MLSQLRIVNVVLIKNLTIDFNDKLCVFTGETGAGKSILLDSLGLALGVRADSSLVRNGENSAQVSAVFYLKKHHKVIDLLLEQNIPIHQNEIILRRELNKDGRSKAFINDTPVSIGFLSTIGEELVEIHSQFDNQRLFNIQNHRKILDSYARNENLIADITKCYNNIKIIEAKIQKEKENQDIIKRDEDYIRFVLDELNLINPKIGEEEDLDTKRNILLNSSKIINNLELAIANLEENNVVDNINQAYKSIDKISGSIGEDAELVKQKLDSASITITDALDTIRHLLNESNNGDMDLASIEERLFSLRSLARKHRVTCDELTKIADDYSEKLSKLSSGSKILEELLLEFETLKNTYKNISTQLTKSRVEASKGLDFSVEKYLKDLKLAEAKFITSVETDENTISEFGADKVVFLVSTNRGSKPEMLNKIASGGEMARFMLALKIALAETDTVPTLIFDEVDAGVGGEVAEAVGNLLHKLSQHFQVFVVTHAHQIAARSSSHYNVRKIFEDNSTQSIVTKLTHEEKIMEVARMISGAVVTEEAIATAKKISEFN